MGTVALRSGPESDIAADSNKRPILPDFTGKNFR